MQGEVGRMGRFYVLIQNNSGGFYEIDNKLGHIVIIEIPDSIAETYDAEKIADYIENRYPIDTGIYFNGVEEGIDCECCGDRWSIYHLNFSYSLDDEKLYEILAHWSYDRAEGDIQIRLIRHNGNVYQFSVKPYRRGDNINQIKNGIKDLILNAVNS